MYKLLYVDDIRKPNCNNYNIDDIQIDIAVSYTDAIDKIKSTKYDGIDLDHDLGQSKTGYDICKYIVDNNIYFKNILLHTSNPIGKQNMFELLNHYICINNLDTEITIFY